MRTAVLGVGNILLSDEGVGVRAIQPEKLGTGLSLSDVVSAHINDLVPAVITNLAEWRIEARETCCSCPAGLTKKFERPYIT